MNRHERLMREVEDNLDDNSPINRLRRKRARSFGLLMLVMLVVMTAVIVWTLTNPESIGHFIGRILRGINEAQA